MLLLTQKRKLAVTVAVIAGALTGTMLHSATARADRTNQLIATVNLDKIYDPAKWHRVQEATDGLEHERQSYTSIIDDVAPGEGGDAAVPPVDGDTVRKWLDLKESMVLNQDRNTDSNKKTLSGYETAARAGTDRMSTLIAKGDGASVAEKDELTRLGKLRQEAGEALKQRAQAYTDKFQQHGTAVRADLNTVVQTAIKQVADDKNITYVLNSSPIGQANSPLAVVLYSRDADIDITDQVLHRLK
ncbi:MAG: OmpH family outer membrane protein [Armatimonadota bacterium]|nr:OmpH family outer membrane protein [Armatimonadota bacterium]